MIRLLILALIVFAGLLVGPMLIDQKGYVLIAINDWTIESSVVVMVMAILVFYAALQIVEWVLVNVLMAWGKTRNWFGWRRQRVAREKTLSSVLDLAQGNYLIAEKNSVKNAQLSDKPLLNYLTAAQAAQYQGKLQQRDQYLALASELANSQLAVGTTRLKLYIAAQQYDEALTWLLEQDSDTLNQKSILRYAHTIFTKLERWDLLLPILAKTEKFNLIDSEQYQSSFERCQRELLVTEAKLGHQNLAKYYRGLSRKLRNDIDVFSDYCALVIELGQLSEIEAEIFKRLRKQFHEPLLRTLFDANEQQAQDIYQDVAQLTRQYPQQISTFDLAGTLSIKTHHWGKAKEWWQAAVALEPSRSRYQSLASVQRQLGENHGALENFELALKQQ